MNVLQRIYGSSHMRQIYRMELKNQKQNKGESVQNFALEVERLAHLTYSDALPDFTETF